MAFKARLVNGRVEYAATSPPTPAEAVAALRGIDGGDIWNGRAASSEDRAADGGDFSSGAAVTLPLAKVADGGDFSIA